VHPQSIPLLNSLKTFTAKIGPMESERCVRLGPGEAAAIAKGMHNGNNEGPGGSQNAPDLPHCRRNILDVHQHVVGNGKIERVVREW
jgi:hypothetical protein